METSSLSSNHRLVLLTGCNKYFLENIYQHKKSKNIKPVSHKSYHYIP